MEGDICKVHPLLILAHPSHCVPTHRSDSSVSTVFCVHCSCHLYKMTKVISHLPFSLTFVILEKECYLQEISHQAIVPLAQRNRDEWPCHRVFTCIIFTVLSTQYYCILFTLHIFWCKMINDARNMRNIIYIYIYIYIHISWILCPRAGPSLQAQEPSLQFCRRQSFHHKLRNQGCSFTRDWIGAVASRCFPHPTLFSIWTDLERSEKIPGAPTWRRGEWIWLTGPSGLHRNSPQGLNISSIRVFDQIKDLEIPITLRPMHIYIQWE